jgi:hypothetical protein
MKPLIADLVVTVNVSLRTTDEDALTDGVSTLEDGIKSALGDLLYRKSEPFGEIEMSVESVDGVSIRDYGDFAEIETCPVCETPYALKRQVEAIQEKGSCTYCASSWASSATSPSTTPNAS